MNDRNIYLKLNNGLLDYSANQIIETQSYVALIDCGEGIIDKSVCDAIYMNKEDPQLVNQKINGLYTVVLFDKINNDIYMFQDEFGYLVPLYFYYTDESFVCSMSLRKLIPNIEGIVAINRNAVTEFLYSGFICGKETLVDNIFKLPVLYCAKYSCGKINFNKYTPIWYKSVVANDYEELFSHAILDSLSGKTEANITLSGGYDSNFILHVLKRVGFSINAYTGGGVVGIDESVVAADICSIYKDVTLHVVKVDSQTLEDYPKIVLLNEGVLYERGIFMHYLLAQCLKNDRVNSIICGDGADQVLSKNFVFGVSEYENVGSVDHNPWETNPYEMLSYIALKKTGCFLHHYGITPKFPYLNRDFINHANTVKEINGTSKDYHKLKLKEIINPNIYELLNRNGGSTNLKPLFNDKSRFDKYKAIAQASTYYKMLPPQPNRYGEEENQYDAVLKVLYIMIFEKLFVDKKYAKACLNDIFDKSIDEVLGECYE